MLLREQEAKGIALDGMKLPSSGGEADPPNCCSASLPPATRAVSYGPGGMHRDSRSSTRRRKPPGFPASLVLLTQSRAHAVRRGPLFPSPFRTSAVRAARPWDRCVGTSFHVHSPAVPPKGAHA